MRLDDANHEASHGVNGRTDRARGVSDTTGLGKSSRNPAALIAQKQQTMVKEVFESLEKNPIFSGGLTLMLIGSAAALLRNFRAAMGVCRAQAVDFAAHFQPRSRVSLGTALAGVAPIF